MLVFFLQGWWLTCHCVHTLTRRVKPREARDRKIYFKIFEKTQYIMNTLYNILTHNTNPCLLCENYFHSHGPLLDILQTSLVKNRNAEHLYNWSLTSLLLLFLHLILWSFWKTSAKLLDFKLKPYSSFWNKPLNFQEFSIIELYIATCCGRVKRIV